MKYLKRINLNESKYEDILDILDIITDLKDDNIVEESKFIMIYTNNKLELEVSMVRNHFKTENNIESLKQTSHLLNYISDTLVRISQIYNISFSFSGDKLSIFFDYNKNIKKFFSKVNNKGKPQQTSFISCSKEKLINALKEALIGYQKNVGKYESEFEFIQDEDFEEIAQDIIDFCN